MTTRLQTSACLLSSLLISMILAAVAGAQTYPNRPITFVVPFAAGGLSDVPGRVLAAEMQARIGQTIVVENRPGASGVTGATTVLRAEPDGYTLLVNALADVQNLHYLSVPYDPIKDFALIGMVDRRAAACAHRQCEPALQVGGEFGCGRQGEPDQDKLRNLRSRHFAGDLCFATQRACQDEHRAGAL